MSTVGMVLGWHPDSPLRAEGAVPCRDRGRQTCTLGRGPSLQTAAIGEQGAGTEGCGQGTTSVTGPQEHSDPGSEPVSRTESAPTQAGGRKTDAGAQSPCPSDGQRPRAETRGQRGPDTP